MAHLASELCTSSLGHSLDHIERFRPGSLPGTVSVVCAEFLDYSDSPGDVTAVHSDADLCCALLPILPEDPDSGASQCNVDA